MKREFPFYVRQMSGDAFPTVSIIEVTEDGWTEIVRTLKKDDPNYIRFEFAKNIVDVIKSSYWETSYWHNPDYEGTQYEYEQLKFEFLNFADKTFKR